MRVVLTGAPNVGKSSLMNILCQKDRAIVSRLAGTTRDLLSVDAILGGYPVVFVDTAGVRYGDSVDEVEQEVSDFAFHTFVCLICAKGVRRAVNAASEADLRLCVQDASSPHACCESAGGRISCRCAASIGMNTCIVFNKIDCMDQDMNIPHTCKYSTFQVSCETRAGIAELISSLTEQVKHLCQTSQTEGPALIRQRQLSHLRATLSALSRAEVLQRSTFVLLFIYVLSRMRKMMLLLSLRSFVARCMKSGS